MNVSALVCITDPVARQDPWFESISSVLPWADEVIVVCGKPETDIPLIKGAWTDQSKFKLIDYPWATDWSWEELPKHLNRGLEEASGDWVIRFDIDYAFHENDSFTLRDALTKGQDCKIANFQKMSAVLSTKFYSKGEIALGINKRFPEVCFGIDENKVTDLCVPIIKTGTHESGIPKGHLVETGGLKRTGVRVYNYDYTFKTKEFTQREFYRFSMAYKRFYGSSKWGQDEEEALTKFMNSMEARLKNREPVEILVDEQPLVMRSIIKNIKPEQFGFNGWGHLDENK